MNKIQWKRSFDKLNHSARNDPGGLEVSIDGLLLRIVSRKEVAVNHQHPTCSRHLYIPKCNRETCHSFVDTWARKESEMHKTCNNFWE